MLHESKLLSARGLDRMMPRFAWRRRTLVSCISPPQISSYNPNSTILYFYIYNNVVEQQVVAFFSYIFYYLAILKAGTLKMIQTCPARLHLRHSCPLYEAKNIARKVCTTFSTAWY
jgi:hypothetical protein